MTTLHYDIIIVGGGMVGANLAIGFAQKNMRVALIEQRLEEKYQPSQAPNIRVTALNLHTANLLEELNSWQHILKMRYRAYDKLSVWEHENFKSEFSATDVQQPLLGYFVENHLIKQAAYREIELNDQLSVDCFIGHTVKDVDAKNADVLLDNGQCLSARMLVASDGAQSLVRNKANIATRGWQYAQLANAILIETQQTVDAHTWQVFNESGPRALLPMYDNYACLIWYDSAAKTSWLKHLQDKELKKAISLNFPYFDKQCSQNYKIIQKASFPIARMHALSYFKGKTVLVGDACHTINPLAGQGLNLGFQDAAALLALTEEYGLENLQEIFKRYQSMRKKDNLLMMNAMDAFYFGFSNQLLPLKLVRNMALKVVDSSAFIKQNVLKYALGLNEV